MPDKVPVVLNFIMQNPKFVVGDAELTLDSDGISCSVNLTNKELNGDEYYVGGFYNHVESHRDENIKVIDSCRLICMSIVASPADKNYKIVKV